MERNPANRYIVSEHYRSFRLDRFLQAMIPKLSRARIQAAIRTRVEVSWHPRPRASTTVQPGGTVTIFFPTIVEPEAGAAPAVLHEDEAILVADKPAGLLVHPTHSCLKNNLIHILRAGRSADRLALAHRLDRETSGVILLTKGTAAARAVASQFERRTIEKTYLAVVLGRVARAAGRIDAPLGVSQALQVIFRRSTEGRDAQHAVTDYTVLARGDGISLVMLRPHTGRRHQLRAHLSALGHPIVGDKLYALSDRDFLRHLRGRLDEQALRSLLADRHLLHAFRLGLTHPTTGSRVTFEAPVPEDFLRILSERSAALPATIPEFAPSRS